MTNEFDNWNIIYIQNKTRRNDNTVLLNKKFQIWTILIELIFLNVRNELMNGLINHLTYHDEQSKFNILFFWSWKLKITEILVTKPLESLWETFLNKPKLIYSSNYKWFTLNYQNNHSINKNKIHSMSHTTDSKFIAHNNFWRKKNNILFNIFAIKFHNP